MPSYTMSSIPSPILELLLHTEPGGPEEFDAQAVGNLD